MSFDNSFLQVPKTARLTWLREEKPKSSVIVVLHGYGQLSTYFSRKLGPIADRIDICVAEGMNRFYTDGTSGRVGASWMTKEERIIDIEDNQVYMHTLLQQLKQDYKNIHLLGFSQGAATAARTFAVEKDWQSLTIWAGVFPPDVSTEDIRQDPRPCIFALGDQDQYFNAEAQQRSFEAYRQLGFETIAFEGPHDILPPPLLTCADRLRL